MSWLSPHARRERDIRMFGKAIKKQLFQEIINQLNVVFYNTLPQDVVSYLICFISPDIDIRRNITLYKRNYSLI
jgi:hypothetical protein